MDTGFPDIKNISIDRYKNKAEIIRLLAAQIEKDFAQFGMEVNFSGETVLAYTELFDQLTVHLSHLLDKDYHRLVLLLYQIDLNEQQVKREELKNPDISKSDLLAQLIILRELKKVLIRLYYKEHPEKF